MGLRVWALQIGFLHVLSCCLAQLKHITNTSEIVLCADVGAANISLAFMLGKLHFMLGTGATCP